MKLLLSLSLVLFAQYSLAYEEPTECIQNQYKLITQISDETMKRIYNEGVGTLQNGDYVKIENTQTGQVFTFTHGDLEDDQAGNLSLWLFTAEERSLSTNAGHIHFDHEIGTNAKVKLSASETFELKERQEYACTPYK